MLCTIKSFLTFILSAQQTKQIAFIMLLIWQTCRAASKILWKHKIWAATGIVWSYQLFQHFTCIKGMFKLVIAGPENKPSHLWSSLQQVCDSSISHLFKEVQHLTCSSATVGLSGSRNATVSLEVVLHTFSGFKQVPVLNTGKLRV